MESLNNALDKFSYLRDTETLDMRERAVAAGGGAFLTMVGMAKGGFSGFLMSTIGGALALTGFTGVNPIYTEEKHKGNKAIIRQSVLVFKDRETVYNYWRNLQNLPKVMKHVKKIDEHDEVYSRWHVELSGIKAQWDAEIVYDVENWRISWNSLPESKIQNIGKVEFEDTGDGYTLVNVLISYKPSVGAVGTKIASALKPVFEQQVREDIMKWKDVIEKEA